MAPYLQAFEEGLRELGYLKGRDFIIDSRSANGNPELVSPAAAELVRLKVDVILTGVNQGIVSARQATTTIPIVMVYGIDPVGAGFIKSLAHHGGNITGGTFEALGENRYPCRCPRSSCYRARRNATRSAFSAGVSCVARIRLKNSTVSSSVNRRPSCK
jgi:hypothetical protein